MTQHRSATVAAYLGITNRTMLNWLEAGYIRSTPIEGEQKYRHSLTTAEATIANLMVLIKEAGLDASQSAPIARYMYNAGPKTTSPGALA